MGVVPCSLTDLLHKLDGQELLLRVVHSQPGLEQTHNLLCDEVT